VAPAASVLYARNLFNFVQLLVDAKTKELKIDTGDDLVRGTLLTQGGQVVHEALKPPAAAATAATA
jgi:NAD(P) transhydrogenase subunit alpha